MAITSDKVIEIAKAEVGYVEKSSSAYKQNNQIVYSKTDGAGSDNYTKYWAEIYPSFQAQPWCDVFISWCFVEAYGKDKANELLCGGVNSYATVTSATYFNNKGRLDKSPKVGDQIFFTNSGTIKGIYHTGIVTGYDGVYVYTIEGNTSSSKAIVANGGGVFEKKYLYNNYSNKLYFGHPPYENSTTGSTKPTVTTPSASKIFPYAAVVTGIQSGLTRRTGPGTSYPAVKILGQSQYFANGAVVSISEEKNGFGRLTDVQEWISLTYIKA